jgi:phenylacetate-CoA ligase
MPALPALPLTLVLPPWQRSAAPIVSTPLGIGETGDRAEALARAIDRARRDVPFYRDHLTNVSGITLADLPTCTKADLRPYGRFPLSTCSPTEAHRVAATSGTTGPRLFIAYSMADWLRIGKQLADRARQSGFGPGDLLLNTHGYGLWIGGPTLDLLANVSGAALLPAGPTSTAQVIEWLGELPIAGISATPSYMRYLIETAQRQRVDPRSWGLRRGFIGGEGAGLSLRRQVSDALGGQFVWQEFYGSTETGGPVLGYSRPEAPLAGELLIDTREFIVEILHPDRDEPVTPGEAGELVVTAPFREATPLLRYRTRDLAAEIVDGRQHPSGLPRITSILGRIDDALKVRGALVYPSAIEDVVTGFCAPGAEWRIDLSREPGGLDVLTVRAELESESAAAGLRQLLLDRLAVQAVVEAVPPGSLDRFQGKANRVNDNRAKE